MTKMRKDTLSTIKIPQGCQDWHGVKSVPWVLDLIEAGLTKKAIAGHFGKTVAGIDKAIARYLKQKKGAADTTPRDQPKAGSSKKHSTQSPTSEGNAHNNKGRTS